MASSDFGHMLSVGAIRFEDRFCASKKGGIGGGGWVHPGVPCTWQLPWLAREEPWSGSDRTISCLVSTNELRNHSSRLVGAPFLNL